MSAAWQVYMVLCCDGTLYTGITTDVNRRVSEHNSKKGGARYTKSRQPVRLLYMEPAASRAMAARREWRIKQMAATDKWSLAGECRPLAQSPQGPRPSAMAKHSWDQD